MEQLIQQHHLLSIWIYWIIEESKMTEIIKSTLRIVCTTLEEVQVIVGVSS